MKGFLLGFTLLGTLSSVISQEDKGLLKCDQGSHRCADNFKCVLDTNLCDFKKDCDDLSDENLLICETIHGKRSSCQPGQIYSNLRACQPISTICMENSEYYDQEFPTLCNDIKDGLKPFEEISAVRKEILDIRREESKLKDLFGQLASSFHTSNSMDDTSRCPPLYVNIGSKCVALFSIAQVSWPEAKQFCESISGKLGILSELKDYQELQEYMKNNDFSSNFWLGGYLEQNSTNWTWINGNDVEMGAPYWTVYKTPVCTKRKNSAVCYEYSVMPIGTPNGCLAMDYQYYYYFSDANCYEKRSPICFYK